MNGRLEGLSYKIEDIKNYMETLELKNKTIKIKNSMDQFDSRKEMTKVGWR